MPNQDVLSDLAQDKYTDAEIYFKGQQYDAAQATYDYALKLLGLVSNKSGQDYFNVSRCEMGKLRCYIERNLYNLDPLIDMLHSAVLATTSLIKINKYLSKERFLSVVDEAVLAEKLCSMIGKYDRPRYLEKFDLTLKLIHDILEREAILCNNPNLIELIKPTIELFGKLKPVNDNKVLLQHHTQLFSVPKQSEDGVIPIRVAEKESSENQSRMKA